MSWILDCSCVANTALQILITFSHPTYLSYLLLVLNFNRGNTRLLYSMYNLASFFYDTPFSRSKTRPIEACLLKTFPRSSRGLWERNGRRCDFHSYVPKKKLLPSPGNGWWQRNQDIFSRAWSNIDEKWDAAAPHARMYIRDHARAKNFSSWSLLLGTIEAIEASPTASSYVRLLMRGYIGVTWRSPRT